MDKIKCFECDEEFDDEKKLHRHFRSHKIKIADYYYKHYDKKDLYSDEPIEFKSRIQYL